jgi:protein SCO1/2
MKFRHPVWLYVTIGAVAALAGALLARMLSQSPVPLAGGTWLPQARPVAAFSVMDHDNKPFGNAQLKGEPHLLFFGFTYCPDICPTTLATFSEALAVDGLRELKMLFVTVDPERDTAENLRQYLGAFSSHFIGLRGDAKATAPLLKSLGAIAARQNLPDGSYTMDHTAAVYLLDERGRYAAVFTPPFTTARVRSDLQRIAAAGRL